MYIPHYYKNENIDEVKDFLRKNSFGILITTSDKKILASHIPLELEKDADGKEVIYGHVSKANRQWQKFAQETEVLMIFNGPHSYVSSSWYEQEEVPTWNYIAVHIYGSLKIIDEAELRYSLDLLINKYEKTSKNPVRLDELSDKTMRQIKGIVGFKVFIKDIQAAYKMSQNRNQKDYDKIIEHLTESSNVMENKTAEHMKKRKQNDGS